MSRRSHPQRLVQAARPGRAAAALLGATALLLSLHGGLARGDEGAERGFVVIVHPSNPMRSASTELVAQAFLKRTVRWSHGDSIRPVDQNLASPVRRAFSLQVLKRSVGALRAYWLQRVFSGRDVPPPVIESDAAVIRYVLSSKGAIGYVSTRVDPSPAKILTLE